MSQVDFHPVLILECKVKLKYRIIQKGSAINSINRGYNLMVIEE